MTKRTIKQTIQAGQSNDELRGLFVELADVVIRIVDLIGEPEKRTPSRKEVNEAFEKYVRRQWPGDVGDGVECLLVGHEYDDPWTIVHVQVNRAEGDTTLSVYGYGASLRRTVRPGCPGKPDEPDPIRGFWVAFERAVFNAMCKLRPR